ncbi:hypothetical protein PQX77_021405 [Marasmius sp. AFHP31]|nr:hypothetical protein PQX77_021405 [Marasmius sp. AFHP31]
MPRSQRQPASRTKNPRGGSKRQPASKTKKTSTKKARELKTKKTRGGNKRDQTKSINKRLRLVLGQLHLLAGLRDPQRPLQLPAATRRDMFIGATDGVTGPSHPKFRALGRIFFFSEGRSHYPEPPQPDIPLAMLEGSTHLRNLLAERAILQGDSQKASEDPADDEGDIVPQHAPSDATTVAEVADEDEGDDFEIVAVHLGGYDVKTWIWLSNHEPAASFIVRAEPENDFALTLNSMKMALGAIGVEVGDEVERSVYSVWRRQRWSAPFVVKRGACLVLRRQGLILRP